MGETANQIESHIETTRQNLGSNIQELEEKVKSVTDWRHQVQTRPMTMLGVAFGGGVLLASMLGNGKRRKSFSAPGDTSYSAHVGTNRQEHKALETWENIKGALIGVAATRFKDFVAELVPDFNEQFQHTQAKNRSVPGPETM
jgi:hypothetical protein